MKHIKTALYTFLASLILFSCNKEEEKPQATELALSTETIALAPEQTATVDITSGSGQYTVVSENPAIATAVLQENKVSLTAVAKGQTHITVTDTQTQQLKRITLTVAQLSVSEATQYVGINATTTLTLTGSGHYQSSSDKPEVATATIQDNTLTLKGLAAGRATITVKDNLLQKEVTVELWVFDTNPVAKELEWVVVEGGTFQMGTPAGTDKSDGDENPVHAVTLSTYKIGKYEVTNAQYAEFLNKNGAGNKQEGQITWYNLEGKDAYIRKVGDAFAVLPGKEEVPVNNVTWYGAVAYAQWKGGRLPTEAEWEYAARGGKHSENYTFIGSNDGNEVGWNRDNLPATKGPQKIGTKKPNELGIYDLAGNLNEYCSDWYGAYSAEAQTNPQGPTEAEAIPHRTLGVQKVLRGGSYQGSVNYFFAWDRNKVTRDSKTTSSCGFRIVTQ